MNGKWIVCMLAGLAVLLAVSCSKQRGNQMGFRMPPMVVEASPVVVQPVSENFEAVGTIEALEAITVVSEIDGLVKALPFSEGGFIRKGERIALLDDSQLAAEVARTQALYNQGKVTYDRINKIVEQGAGSAQDLDDAAAALKVAAANLQLARARYDKTVITAPFNGLIGSRRVSVGSFIRPGEAITDLANIDNMRVTFSAPERFLAMIHLHAEVHLVTTAFPDDEVMGKITVIEPMIDPGTRSARVLAQVQNPGRRLRPGMSANIHAVLSEREHAVTIPNEAVFGREDQSFVYVIQPDSTVTRKSLKLGTRLPDVVEVLDGLEPGMNIVRAGHQKLFEGGKVMPIMTTTSAAVKGDGITLSAEFK